MESLTCKQCGHEFARFEGNPGNQRLVINPPEMAIKIITKDPLLGEIECPKCHYKMTIVAEWMKRF